MSNWPENQIENGVVKKWPEVERPSAWWEGFIDGLIFAYSSNPSPEMVAEILRRKVNG